MSSRGESAVLVLAAGTGTRMRSDIPKVLHPIAGRSMLSHVLHAVAKVAPQHLVVVLGQQRAEVEPAIAELADELGRTIDVALQEQQLGTGHAAQCGLATLPDDFDGVVVVTSGDAPLLDADTLADLIATHSAEPAAVTVLTTTLADPNGYGRILRTQDREVIAIVEQSDATPSQQAIQEVNAGVYAFDIAALRSALNRLSSDNAQHELYLTDVIAILRSDHQTVHAKHVDDSALVVGVNDRVQLSALAAELNRRIVADHQRAGVTIIDPATTWIDVEVTVGHDAVIRPGPNCWAAPASVPGAGSGRTPPSRTSPSARGHRWSAPTDLARKSGRTPTSGPTPTRGPGPRWAPAPSWARSSRPRTRSSVQAPRSRT